MKKTSFAFLMMVLCVVFFFSLQAKAEEGIASGECGTNLTWTLNEDGVLTISFEKEKVAAPTRIPIN